MGKPISFADIDQVNSKLKKARAVLCLVQDGLPTGAMDDDTGWALCAAFDYIHDTMIELDKLVDEARAK